MDYSSHSMSDRSRGRWAIVPLAAAILALTVLVLMPAAPALAGQAGSGELFFYPCTSCHPTGTARALPNGFEAHEVELEGHDKLGRGDAACLACHDEPGKDPGKLKLADGSLIDIKGDTAQVCFRCHSAKYEEWKAGAHGRRQPSCTAAGCHDPHTPGYMYSGSVRPFVGTGFQFKVLPEREEFSPLAAPPLAPPVTTPRWLGVFAALGFVAAGGQVVRLVRGRL